MTRANLDKRPGEVSAMFDQVAERYDLLNDVLSLGQDRWWRRVVARAVGARPGELVLDLAAGTGTSSRTFTAGRRGLRGVRLLARHAPGRGAQARPAPAAPIRLDDRPRSPAASRARSPSWLVTRSSCRSATRPSTR